jgi:hypothetical protein
LRFFAIKQSAVVVEDGAGTLFSNICISEICLATSPGTPLQA